jgi:tetratricopeptide (TPR) repeat protein
MKHENRLIRLDSLLDTYAYFKSDPLTSDRISATFIRYLIDRYQIGQFLELYRKADDINLRSEIVATYGKPIGTLETEWLTWLDTVPIPFEQLAYHAELAETRFDYAAAHEYSGEMLTKARSFRDSLVASSMLARTAFFAGEYYAAAERQTGVIDMLDTLSGEWVQLAGYHMMNGEYDSAGAALSRAQTRDSANSLVPFNQGLQRLCVGDTTGARQFFSLVIAGRGETGGLLESQAMLGNILSRSSDPTDKAEALNLFNAVVATLSRQDNRHNPSASQLMWLGIAYLGIGDTDNADDYLQTAMFLETRVFYQGMIDLWLGKVADVRGERAVARDYYQRVLAGASAHYHQEEARSLLERPYRR